ncbi:hypothetical protein BIY21_06850 [Vibrio ponticus]|uniref:Uncharacterized protein n=1 Tax=Vibrio ponticus TaxID=265668 RepID=A0ABX3FRU1_9VIBR|nr:hypothetical protein [Vibrio ponticus]OLQ95163.1 hypothetical protein BIY21_06850 [Vibrio ponticus]
MKKLIVLMAIGLSSFAIAQDGETLAAIDHGFVYKGSIINPKCVNLLQAWPSESSKYGIILRSVILDSCQESNLAFEGRDYSITSRGANSYSSNTNDENFSFQYEVLGKTEHDVFAVLHSGYIGLYRLEAKQVRFDFGESDDQIVSVLTKLSQTWVPCFESANVQGNQLQVVKHIWNPDAPTADQCSDRLETVTYDLSLF